jgi:hypothetical protein
LFPEDPYPWLVCREVRTVLKERERECTTSREKDIILAKWINLAKMDEQASDVAANAGVTIALSLAHQLSIDADARSGRFCSSFRSFCSHRCRL